MTTHVTPQTATRLKQAGFPQPEQKPGQFWYLQDRLYVIVTVLTYKAGKTAILYEICGEHRDPDPLPVSLPFSDAFVYAPGIEEILRELGGSHHLEYYAPEDEFAVWGADGRKFNANPAIVLSVAWASKQGKP